MKISPWHIPCSTSRRFLPHIHSTQSWSVVCSFPSVPVLLNRSPSSKFQTLLIFEVPFSRRIHTATSPHINFYNPSIPSSSVASSSPPPILSDLIFSATSERSQQLLPLLSHFQAPIRFAFAYGSAAFSQLSSSSTFSSSSSPSSTSFPNSKSGLMLDLIFGVTHPHHWHSMNLKQNRHHYSSLASFGSSVIAWAQEKSAGVYFNPYVNLNGTIVKYGVVSIDRLCKDLTDWETLYLSGRMQKPIQILRHDSRVSLCQTENLIHALSLALLVLPTHQPCSFYELYSTITRFSYSNDFRMQLKGMESPKKIENIVQSQYLFFQSIYQPLFQSKLTPFFKQVSDSHFLIHSSLQTKRELLFNLPLPFLKKWNEFTSIDDLAQRPDLTTILQSCLKSTVARVALTQSIKGIFTAGLKKSVVYAKEKHLKSQAS